MPTKREIEIEREKVIMEIHEKLDAILAILAKKKK